MFDLDMFIIAVYCLVDDHYRQLFPNGVRQRGFEPELTDQEALTIEIVGEFLGLERDKAIFEYFYRHYRPWFPALRDRTLLVRQWANLWLVKSIIWQAIVRDSGACYDYQLTAISGARRWLLCQQRGVLLRGERRLRIASNGMIVHAPLLPPRPHDSQLTDELLAGVPLRR